MSTDALRPAHGARYVLEREDATEDGTRAVYRGEVVTAEAAIAYRVEMSDDGGVILKAVHDAALSDQEAMLSMIARLTARGAAARRADGLQPWPARVTRWRGPGRGA